MKFIDLKIRAQSAPWHNSVNFLLYQNRPDGGKSVITDFIIDDKNDYFAAGPSFSLDYDQAQVLMDDLWNAGVRPTEGSGSAGSLRATEKHLDDMRAVVAKQLGVDFKIAK